MKFNIYLLISYLYISSFSCFLYGWNNEHWLGNCDRVIAWNGAEPAGYLRLGVLDDGVYRLSAGDIAVATGVSTNSALSALNSGLYVLTCGINSVSWTTDGTNLFFYGQATHQQYAPENVYFLRTGSGLLMDTQPAAPLPASGTNTWFMQGSSHRASFLDVTAYFDRRSSNASIMTEPIFGMSLGDSWCNRTSCEFAADLPGYDPSAATGIVARVHAISYGDYGAASDTHLFELSVEGSSCGTHSWSDEQKVVYQAQVPLSLVTNNQPVVRVDNLTVSEHILLLDVEMEYPRPYQLMNEPLLCSGGVQSNILVSGSQVDPCVRFWDVTDPLNAVNLDLSVNSAGNGWSAVFGCGGVTSRYAIFETDSCFEPSVTGFTDIDWTSAGAIPELVIVTPPRRWVSGFEEALAPLVELRRNWQRMSVRVVDAEDVYNAFSDGLVNPHAFQSFTAAGLNSGTLKPLRYLLFAGYASTDYKLEVFHPDTVFKSGKKGFPALFPLMQVFQEEPEFDAMLLLPNDMMLGDADNNGVPDVAVGRFLATDAAELAGMVAKTVTHDRKHPWNRALIVSDWNNTGNLYYNFNNVCTLLSSEYIQGGWDSDYYYCATDTGFNRVWKDTFYETGVWYDLQDGRDFFYYLGHSSDTQMGHSGLDGEYLLKDGGTRLINADWVYTPLAMCMGCRMGRYTSLDVKNLTPCLMETAVKNPSSVFSSVISAAGYLTFGDARSLSESFSDEINLYGALTVGDAYLATLDQMGAGGLQELQHLVLLGDPSMRLRKGEFGTVFKLQ